jgi:DNA repair protein RadC
LLGEEGFSFFLFKRSLKVKKSNFKSMLFRKKVFSREDIVKEFWNVYQKLSPPERRKEHLWQMLLDAGYGIIDIKLIKTATPEGTEITMRDVFFYPFYLNAPMFALCHNHPNNSPEPSLEDIELTKRVAELSRQLGLVFLDHIILCENGIYASILEKGKKKKSVPLIRLKPHMTNLKVVAEIMRKWGIKK